jgi:hypothetical protein
VRTSISIAVPQVIGQGVPVLFITVGFDFYSDIDVAYQPYVLGLVLPLTTVAFHILARLFAYRLYGRVTEVDTSSANATAANTITNGSATGVNGDGASASAAAAHSLLRDDIPVVTGTSDAWVLSYLLTFLLALAGRVLVSSVGGVGNQAIAAAVLGDALGHRILWCRRPIPSDSLFFADTDKVRFLSDTAIGAMIATYSAIPVASAYVLLADSEHHDADALSTLLVEALARIGVQLGIALCVDVIGCAIQLRLAFPLVTAWHQRWRPAMRRWLPFVLMISVVGGCYFTSFALALLRRQARDHGA